MLLLGGFPAICCNIGRFLLISAEETLAACMSPCEPVYEGEVGSNLDRIERTLYARSHSMKAAMRPILEQPILQEFKRRVQQRFPGELIRVVLFGSKARGDASVESDIDILAVVRSEDWKLGDEVRDIGYELEIAHSVVLSIQVMGQRQYQDLKARGSSFLAQVEQEGVAV